MKARETERERKRRASERMRRERASYAEIVFLQFNFECKKKGEKTRREKCGARLSGATVANCVSRIVQI